MRLRSDRGFTWIELLIVIAIIIILLAVICPIVLDARCKLKNTNATAVIHQCETLLSAPDPKPNDVLTCLTNAQKLIDELEAQNWFSTASRAAATAGAKKVNELVDSLIARTEDQTTKDKLTKAKLNVPRAGSGTTSK